MICNIFLELLRVLSFLHDPCVIILILLINVSFNEITYFFEEFPDVFIILENLPVVPYLYVVLQFKSSRGSERRGCLG